MALLWLSLAFLVVITIASSVVVTRRALEAFRAAKHLNRALAEELDRINRTSAEIEKNLRAAATSGGALDTSLARLRRSRSALAVLTSALADVRASVGRITSVVPRSK